MASSVCQKISPLMRIVPDRPRHKHAAHQSLMPFPASPSSLLQDPLPCTSYPQNFLIFPSPSLTNAPFARSVFQDEVHMRPVPDQELESAELSADSSISSGFMSSNSDEDDDTGSSSTSSFSQMAASQLDAAKGPLDNLMSLSEALPIKRGLSCYFSGKSQSFSSLAQVSSVADLAKPENPFVKRRRMGVGADSLLKHHSYPPRCASSAGISKRPTTSNRYKSLRSLPRPEDTTLEGLANLKQRPAKCFSVPEF
eukprot:c1145_g1_i1 orf=203-964(-)